MLPTNVALPNKSSVIVTVAPDVIAILLANVTLAVPFTVSILVATLPPVTIIPERNCVFPVVSNNTLLSVNVLLAVSLMVMSPVYTPSILIVLFPVLKSRTVFKSEYLPMLLSLIVWKVLNPVIVASVVMLVASCTTKLILFAFAVISPFGISKDVIVFSPSTTTVVLGVSLTNSNVSPALNVTGLSNVTFTTLLSSTIFVAVNDTSSSIVIVESNVIVLLSTILAIVLSPSIAGYPVLSITMPTSIPAVVSTFTVALATVIASVTKPTMEVFLLNSTLLILNSFGSTPVAFSPKPESNCVVNPLFNSIVLLFVTPAAKLSVHIVSLSYVKLVVCCGSMYSVLIFDIWKTFPFMFPPAGSVTEINAPGIKLAELILSNTSVLTVTVSLTSPIV